MDGGPGFNWKAPNYSPIFRRRLEILVDIRAEDDPAQAFTELKLFYKDHPLQFIQDWGCTVDPRLVEQNLPAVIPFVPFPRQLEWGQWVLERWRAGTPGLTEKSRDGGLSWMAIALSCTLCLFNDGMAIGFGSRKEEYVDKIDSPKSLFHKGRVFMSLLPEEFRGGWTLAKHAPHMRLTFPDTKASIAGEAGDGIGRGDRTSIYFVDEAAHLERPQMVEASLASTTNCRIDISSVNGPANPFAIKRHGGKIKVFTFHWRDDPRKDQAWRDKKGEELDPITVAQEIDIDYHASTEGALIPYDWALAAVDAHLRLGIEPSGEKRGALDVADDGKDKNAFSGMHGIVLEHLDEWSGKGGDIYNTVVKSFSLCDTLGYKKLKYDNDGLGAGVRGDARVINEARGYGKTIEVEGFRGSEGVFDPDKPVDPDAKGSERDRLNKDFFQNRKAQSWWALRNKFKKTHRAVTTGTITGSPDDLISISSMCKDHRKLLTELAQVTYSLNNAGKMVIDKAPDGAPSPNLADSVNICSSSLVRKPMSISLSAVMAAANKGIRR